MFKFEEVNCRTSFHKLIELTKDIVTLSNLPLTKFMKPQKKLYATSNKQVWVP